MASLLSIRSRVESALTRWAKVRRTIEPVTRLGVLLGIVISPAIECRAQGLSPTEAVRRMVVPDGFEVRAVAAEPLVRQPVCIEFDDRGRLWVIQYLQYPNPAGLNRVQVDRYSRTKYDRVPQPPPHGPRGADRITILTDSDGDGQYDQGRDFIDGLNLATGLAFGHGGVYVLNVPYLLFYPDRDRDDRPDSDPEVLLTGFGMEDAHSVANSLTWGPDGWLYGCQGSTVTANIRSIEFQQGVWRYHPQTREFELFCEGGGNTWGLDFDRVGQLFYSTNYGGFVLCHGVQGSYLIKSFAKHGELHNPHAYGFFNHAPHDNFRGGHVTVGGIVYQGDSFPESFRGKYIAGDLLGHGVYWHTITPNGSTVKTAHSGELVVANDPWFAPTDVTLGPDGALYVSDWHDARTAHPDPDAEWDRSNGRIYRIAAKGTPADPSAGRRSATGGSCASHDGSRISKSLARWKRDVALDGTGDSAAGRRDSRLSRVQNSHTAHAMSGIPAIDFSKASDADLLKLHGHRSQWYVRRARMELARRRIGHETFLESVNSPDETTALESLWSLNAIGAFDEALADNLLNSPHAPVRAWTVRLLGDRRQVSAEMAHRLDKFAEREPSVQVRQQLAATATRLPAAQAMPIINANINRDVDFDDPYIPLLWWWAVERHSVSGREEVLRRFVRPSLWKSRVGHEFLLTRLVRRYASEGTIAGWDSVAQLVKAAPDSAARDTLWKSILDGIRDVSEPQSTDREQLLRDHELTRIVKVRLHERPEDLVLLQLHLALKDRDLFDAMVRDVADPAVDDQRKIARLGLLADVAEPSLVEPLLKLIESNAAPAVKAAALSTLARINDPRIGPALVSFYQTSPAAPVDATIKEIMVGRKSLARLWLSAIDRGEIKSTDLSPEQVQRIALLQDEQLDALVRAHWGHRSISRGDKLAEVRRLNNDLRAGSGDRESGKALFKRHCAACHQLFGEGTKLGPDLTTANRKDRDYLLISLVDPNSVIRKEFTSLIIQTRDGRVVTGFPIARQDSSITLVNAKNEKTIIASSEIEEVHDSPVSLMPDDLYRQLNPQELRDLFSYLEQDVP